MVNSNVHSFKKIWKFVQYLAPRFILWRHTDNTAARDTFRYQMGTGTHLKDKIFIEFIFLVKYPYL